MVRIGDLIHLALDIDEARDIQKGLTMLAGSGAEHHSDLYDLERQVGEKLREKITDPTLLDHLTPL